MRGSVLKEFLKCTSVSSAPNGSGARKREAAFPLPQVKRQKLLASICPQQLAPGLFEISGEENSCGKKEDAADEGVEIEQSGSRFNNGNLTLAARNYADVPTAPQEDEKSCLYPSVVYEGDIAVVKLGVGQMVVLDGCAMVQVLEGQAAMLGYSFPRGADVLVCSSSKPAEVITIEARHALRDGRLGAWASEPRTELDDATAMTQGINKETKKVQGGLGCQLRFASHGLGQQMVSNGAGSGRSLSFRLEFIGSLGSSLGKKRRRQILEQQNQGHWDSPDISRNDQLDLDSKAGLDPDSGEDGDERDHDERRIHVGDVELAAGADNVRKRKECGQNTDSVKRQRVVEMLDCCSSTISIPHDWKEAVDTITLESSAPVIAIAVQRMLESLHLLGS